MNKKNSVPKWFWIVTCIALIWNLLGVYFFIQQLTMTQETLNSLPENQQLLYETMPSWVNIAFAMAVLGGTAGCIGLLLRQSWCIPLFIVSLIGILTQMYYSFFISNSYEVFGPGGLIMPVMIMIIALFLIFFSRMAKGRKWIE
ncbi:hypothetical protein [Abyssalbus ytuae]|uniref:Sugar transporter n=1 Tax=Abyssalbus ytuae TaxID=2926907 RepID=A0A9E6ZMI4_9FLAO|nr:hypothetical protein [Abyssalbus ytuae]UOB16965.1 hypothetical protein MQE35_14650 [Abyssalbus ytuae]